MTTVKYKFDDLMNPVLIALKELGGSGTNEEIFEKVTNNLVIPTDQLEILHNPEKGGISEIEYRLMWTRSYLKKYGLLENSERGVWAITAKGSSLDSVNAKEVVSFVRSQFKKEKIAIDPEENSDENNIAWQEQLLDILLEMTPGAFERLIQRMLRESGFVQVEVTGKSGDGGIDGHGILRMAGLLSFHVIFQAKRWKGSIGPNQIRDFRGAMVGRADKGLFITTGSFTKDAKKESIRDGAPAIDLIDGDSFVEKLRQLSLGVQTQKIETIKVMINPDWFKSI